jgi:hypothetical protein
VSLRKWTANPSRDEIEAMPELHVTPGRIIPFSSLLEADLVVDAVYEGGHNNFRGDPLTRLMRGFAHK